jgi:hypothetical protein
VKKSRRYEGDHNFSEKEKGNSSLVAFTEAEKINSGGRTK